MELQGECQEKLGERERNQRKKKPRLPVPAHASASVLEEMSGIRRERRAMDRKRREPREEREREMDRGHRQMLAERLALGRDYSLYKWTDKVEQRKREESKRAIECLE